MKKLLAVLALATVAFAVNVPCEHDCTITGTGSIAGTITDSVTGLPIDSARVTAGCCHNFAYTDAEGNYVIEGLVAGDYTVKATKCDDYYPKAYPTRVPVAQGQAVTDIDIALRPKQTGGSGSISGIVYDKSTSQPIAEAKVFIDCHRYVYTNENGEYTLGNLADGSYRLKASKEGYCCATWPEPIVITGGAAVTGIDFLLVPRFIDALD